MHGDTVCDSTRPPERFDEQAITLKTQLQGVNEWRFLDNNHGLR
jgi:hypothetical protein